MRLDTAVESLRHDLDTEPDAAMAAADPTGATGYKPVAPTVSTQLAYLDGECDPDTALKVAAHLEACGPCTDESRALEAIKRTLASGRCCGADPDVVANLRAHAERLSQG